MINITLKKAFIKFCFCGKSTSFCKYCFCDTIISSVFILLSTLFIYRITKGLLNKASKYKNNNQRI